MSAETLYAIPVNDYPRTADVERPEPAGAERAALEAPRPRCAGSR